MPYATSEINLVLNMGGGPTQGLPEVAFVRTKASLERGESGRWPWAQSGDPRKSPRATARQRVLHDCQKLREHWREREFIRHPL